MLMLLAARGSSCMACGRKRHFFGVHNALLKPKTLLDDQIAVMRSMRIYRDERPEKDVLLTLPEDDVVQQILELLANRQQLQILKALAGATHTFSRLSQLIDLRGGISSFTSPSLWHVV